VKQLDNRHYVDARRLLTIMTTSTSQLLITIRSFSKGYGHTKSTRQITMIIEVKVQKDCFKLKDFEDENGRKFAVGGNKESATYKGQNSKE
jgi:hypothetical protein